MKQMPEFSRPSLLALARELGTSHQLLVHYLKRLEKWQGEQYFRQAREILARVEAENRARGCLRQYVRG
jgi:predicted secreted protein